MESKNLIFRGNARVYLQGRGALQLVDKSDPQCFTYFVGSMESSIKVNDYRHGSIEEAKATIEGRSEREFADIFNHPSEIEINECVDFVEITIRNGVVVESSPILWMGVIHDGKMPVHEIAWEALRPIFGNVTAFAVLVDD